MKIFLLVCLGLFANVATLNKMQLAGLRAILKDINIGVFPTCRLVLFSELVDFNTAEKRCEEFKIGGVTQQGNLATVNNGDKNDDLKILLAAAYPIVKGDKDRWGPKRWVWAGLRKTKNNGEGLGAQKTAKKYNVDDWSWADGSSPTDFARWFNRKQPDQAVQKKGTGNCQEDNGCLQNQMRINHNGDWDDTYKYKLHPYACDYQGKYLVSASLKTWDEARDCCEVAGLQLAKIRNAEEVAEIKASIAFFLPPQNSSLKIFDVSNWIWVDGSDAKADGEWEYSDGTEVDISWMPWRSPNPDDAQRIGKTGQDALSISKWGQFDDSYIHDRRKRAFACQCPGT